MSKIIQAEARITAIDATGETFAAIAQKVRGVTSAFKSLGNISASGIGRLDRTVGRLQHTMRTIAPVAGSAAAYEGMRGLSGLIHETVKATTEQAHERVRMEAAGIPADERAASEQIAEQLSQRYKALSKTVVMHTLRNVRTLTKSFDDAKAVIDPLMQLRIVAMGAHPDRAAELEDDFDKLSKGMEIKGATEHPEEFRKYMDGMAKAINVFGDTLRPTDYYHMFKYGSVAVQALSPDYMLETAPTFAQEMGGSRTGVAQSMFYAKTVGDQMTLIAANELKRFGLIDMSKVQSKAGRITRLHPGAVSEWQLAASDPYAWVNQVFLPALARHGITDKQRILAEIGTIFGSGRNSSGSLVGVLATQQWRIEKDKALVRGAKGLDAADLFLQRDPLIAAQGVVEQFKNLLAIAGSPLAGSAADGMVAIASGLVAIENATKGHPFVATAGVGAGTLALGAGGSWVGMLAARRLLRTLGLGRPAASAVEDLSVEGAIRAMQAGQLADAGAAGAGWLSSALLPLSLLPAAAAGSIWAGGKAQQIFGDVDVGQKTGSLAPGVGYVPSSFPSLSPDIPKPEVKGSADLNVSVQVEPSDSFISRIVTAIENRINAFGALGNEPGTGVGTAGSTGLSMPPAAPAP